MRRPPSSMGRGKSRTYKKRTLDLRPLQEKQHSRSQTIDAKFVGGVKTGQLLLQERSKSTLVFTPFLRLHKGKGAHLGQVCAVCWMVSTRRPCWFWTCSVSWRKQCSRICKSKLDAGPPH